MISIIVPVYNCAPYIAHTIEMVQKQTYKDWELILVNDCSTDESAEIISDYMERSKDERIKLFHNAQNMGAAATRNHGLQMATGRFIAFLDADDVWFPVRLERGLSFMKDKQAGFVFSSYEFGDEHANPTGKVVQVPEKLSYREALSRTVIFTTTTLFDTQIIPKELLNMPIVASEDTATWWQILRSGYTAYGLKEVLAIYRRPANSLSSNKLQAIKRIWNLYRRVEKLSLLESFYHFVFWAYRATVRRI